MGKGQYVGISGVARKVKNQYMGVGNVARKVKNGFVGIGGVARQFASGGVTVEGNDLALLYGHTVSYGQTLDLSRFSRVRGEIYFGECELQVGENRWLTPLQFTAGYFPFDFALDGTGVYSRELEGDEIESDFDPCDTVEGGIFCLRLEEDRFEPYLYISTTEGGAYCPGKQYFNDDGDFDYVPVFMRYSLSFEE